MDIKKACDLILEIEKNLDVNQPKIFEIHLWPLVRHCIWTILINREQVETNNTGESIRRTVKKLVKNFPILRWILWTYSKTTAKGIRKDTDILFISPSSYYSELLDGKKYSKIIDPVYEELSRKYLINKICFDHLEHKKYFESMEFRLLPVKRKLVKREIELNKRFIKKVCSYDDELEYSTLISYLIDNTSKVLAHKELCSYLLQIVKPKLIITTCYYSPPNLGMMWAATEEKIATVDLQHGKQGKYQAMYSHWTKIPESGYEVLPTWFWNWGEQSVKNIMNWQPDRTVHRSLVSGYPWIKKWKKNNSIKKNNRNIKTILITLQGKQGTHQEIFPDFIVQTMQELGKSCYWIVRPHWNSPDSKKEAKRKLRRVDKEIYSISQGEKEELYRLLSTSDCHATAYSTVCYEASVFGIQTVIWHPQGKELYSDELSSGIFLYGGDNRTFKKAILESAPSRYGSEQYIVDNIKQIALVDEILADRDM